MENQLVSAKTLSKHVYGREYPSSTFPLHEVSWYCLHHASKQRKMNARIPPPIVAALIALGMWQISRMFESEKYVFSYQAHIAILFITCGVILAVMGIRTFIAANTTPNPMRPHKATVLVTSGVHSWSRNPMYLGDLLILMGIAIWLGSLFNMGLLALFVWFINHYQIAPEEEALRKIFGDAYLAYCNRVRRWI